MENIKQVQIKSSNKINDYPLNNSWLYDIDKYYEYLQKHLKVPQNNITMKDGSKYDNNKLRWDLLPIQEIEEVVKVLTKGATKYADNNWQKVDNAKERYYAALLRHLTAWRKGELKDEECDTNHLANVICNAIFLLWFDNNKRDE